MEIQYDVCDEILVNYEIHHICITTSSGKCFEIRENESGDGITVECVKEVIKVDSVLVELR